MNEDKIYVKIVSIICNYNLIKLCTCEARRVAGAQSVPVNRLAVGSIPTRDKIFIYIYIFIFFSASRCIPHTAG